MRSKKRENVQVYDAVCLRSIRGVMDIFGGKWSFLIIEQLHIGTMRFNELHKGTGYQYQIIDRCAPSP
jgi:DNA-binding HxlR family transcriptional regulator